MELTFKPRLTKGRHLHTVDEQGPFCLVEAVGFNVDGKVNDSHGSVDPVLAALARTINDRMCTHYGAIPPITDICDECQGRLWAVGERIAGTGYDTPDWSEGELAAVHGGLALVAAQTVLRLISTDDELHFIVKAALDAAEQCLVDASADTRAAARLAASRIEKHDHANGNNVYTWAAYAAAHATRAAAGWAGDKLYGSDETYFFTNRRSIQAVTYALSATAGDPVGSMRVARRVLNAFGKATSRNANPGVSHEAAAAAEEIGIADVEGAVRFGEAHAAAVAKMRANIAAEEEERAAARRARNRTAYAEANAQERSGYYSAAAPCPERTTVDGIGYGCVKLGEHVEHNTALGAAWWTAPEEYAQAVADDQLDAEDRAGEIDAAERDERLQRAIAAAPSWAACEQTYAEAAAASSEEIWGEAAAAELQEPDVYIGGTIAHAISALVETPTEEYDVMDDFEESELGDVADEAIGDAAALMDAVDRAERILNAIAGEHRPVAAWTRRRPAGFKVDIEYQTDCCVSCRDAEGQPMPAPCRTLVILNSYGEA